jgi:hypothetical protein
MVEIWNVNDEVRARYWTTVDSPEGRWSLHRRPHRVTSTTPFRGVEFWHDEETGYREGQAHDLDPGTAEPYERS